MQKKIGNSQFNIDSVKDPELRAYLQHISSSLTKQNQELKKLSLKNNIFEKYFQAQTTKQRIDLIISEIRIPGCSSIRILLNKKGLFDETSLVTAGSGEFYEAYAYLDEQIIQQLKDKNQLIVSDTTKIHSIKFSPEKKYPKAIGAFCFLQTPEADGFFWISFEAVKEFTEHELELLSQISTGLADISESSVKQENLQSKTAAYEQMLAMIQLPIVLIDRTNHVQYANSAAREQFKDQLEEICNITQIDNWLKSNEPETGIEIDLLERHYQLSGRHLSDKDFLPEAILVFIDDTELEQKQAYLNLIIDTISHDFKISVMNMQGFSKLLGMVGELNPKQSEYLGLISDGVDEISTIVTDLLDVSRIIQDGGLRLTKCNPSEIVQRAVNLVQSDARQKRINIESILSTTNRLVAVDQVMIISAIYNLLIHAVQNSRIGSRIMVEEEIDGKYWKISINDEGKGISQIDIEKLESNHYASKEAPGLSLVYRIAKFQQGKLTVESELGKGSKFILQLPCAG